MANRQRGGRSPAGSGSPAGGRSPAGSRVRRTVPVSRRNASGGWSPASAQESWTPSQPGTPIYTEPEVRRWPHPLEDEALSSAPAPEPALHYIRCALSYQNQLLADIKALLEQLAAAAPAASPAAEPENSGGNLSKM